MPTATGADACLYLRVRSPHGSADREVATENSIGAAFSADGLMWTHGTLPVFTPSSDSIVPLPFDSGDVEHPSFILDFSVPRTQQGFILLWYSADNENSTTPNRIGLARG